MKNLLFCLICLVIMSISILAQKDERPVIIGGTATTGTLVDNDATRSREPYYPNYPTPRRNHHYYYDEYTSKKYYYDRDPRRKYRHPRKPYHGRVYDNMKPESDDILPVRPAYIK